MLQFPDVLQHLDTLDSWGVRDHPADAREAVARALARREHRASVQGEPLAVTEERLAEQIAADEIPVEDALKALSKARRAAEDAAAADALLRTAQREAERAAVARFKAAAPEMHDALRQTFDDARQRFEGGDDAAFRTMEEIWTFVDALREARVLRLPHARLGIELRFARPELVPLGADLGPVERLRAAIEAGASPGIHTGEQIRRNEVTGSLPRRPTMISA